MSFDEAEFFAKRDSIERAVADPNATYRDKLMALRDFVAHELEGSRCKTCFMSKLKEGATASLTRQLKDLLKEIEDLEDPESEEDEFDAIINSESNWSPAPPDFPRPPNGG